MTIRTKINKTLDSSDELKIYETPPLKKKGRNRGREKMSTLSYKRITINKYKMNNEFKIMTDISL